MRILIDVGHPAHVHYFKNLIWEMTQSGHEFLVVAREKEVVHDLLRKYEINFVGRGKGSKSLIGKILHLIKNDLIVLRHSLRFRPSIFLSAGSMYAAHIAWIMRKPHITIEDTENLEQIWLYKPFTKLILSPKACYKAFGKRNIQYDGFHQSAYLRPENFAPDRKIFEYLNLQQYDRYSIIRIVANEASHDIFIEETTWESRQKLINLLETRGRVFISSERDLPQKFVKYKLEIPSDMMHSALYFAELIISESGAVTNESAFLGTPTILYIDQDLGVDHKLEDLGLKRNFKGLTSDVLNYISSIINDLEHHKEVSRQKSTEYISKSINLTDFMIWIVENLPKSLDINFIRKSKWSKYVQ